MTTEKNQPTGKAFDAINGFVQRTLSHQGAARNIKGHTAWMPANLYPNGKGGYAPLNIYGFLIGHNENVKIPKDWLIAADDIDLSSCKPDEDGSINLFGIGYPWETEGNKTEYLGRLINLFKVPSRVVKAGRPAPKKQIYVGG